MRLARQLVKNFAGDAYTVVPRTSFFMPASLGRTVRRDHLNLKVILWSAVVSRAALHGRDSIGLCGLVL